MSKCVETVCNGEVTEQLCGVTQRLAGKCGDWFSGCGNGDFDLCEIPPNDSGKVACKRQSATANTLSGNCYYTCANGRQYTCPPNVSVNSSISGHNPYMGGCSEYPPDSCTGDMSQDTTLPEFDKLPEVDKGQYWSSSSVAPGESSPSSADYMPVLAAIHDTLTHANDYYRNDSLNWDWLRSYYSNIGGPAVQSTAANTSQIAQNTAETNEELEKFRHSVDVAFGELKWEQEKSNNGENHRDSLLEDWRQESAENVDSVFDVLGAIKDFFGDFYDRFFGDSTYEKTSEAARATAEDVRALKDTLSETNGILGEIRDKITSLFSDSVDVPEDNLDSMYDAAKQLAERRDTTTLKMDSLLLDTSKFKTDYSDLFLDHAQTTATCYTFTISNETANGAFWLPSIVVNFGDLMGFDLCAILRIFVRIVGFITCLMITFSSYRAAFASTTND